MMTEGMTGDSSRQQAWKMNVIWPVVVISGNGHRF